MDIRGVEWRGGEKIRDGDKGSGGEEIRDRDKERERY